MIKLLFSWDEPAGFFTRYKFAEVTSLEQAYALVRDLEKKHRQPIQFRIRTFVVESTTEGGQNDSEDTLRNQKRSDNTLDQT